MSNIPPSSRALEIVGSHSEDLLLRRMTTREKLGRLFRFQLEVLSERDDLPLDEFIGKDLTIRLELPSGRSGEDRYFHGYISRIAHAGTLGRYALYQITLRPWLWFLTRTADCRIFQGKTVPQILTDVFNDSHRFRPDRIEELDAVAYQPREYCVQYAETDFDFVSRLMEHEGIYYYFRHECEDDQGSHTLVLSDSIAGHDSRSGYETVPYRPGPEEDDEVVTEWLVSREFEPVRYVLRDYDFTNPAGKAAVDALEAVQGVADTYMIYDYPGAFTEREDGERYARVRLEEIEAKREQIRARTTSLGLSAGQLFGLEEHPRADQNREYLIVSSVHDIGPIDYESGGDAPLEFSSRFTAIDSAQTYRSARRTPKPVMGGPQTAVVVGLPGQNRIYTDEYARIKVRFHWDRWREHPDGSPIEDHDRSCWIRVAQTKAGKGFGTLNLPYVGHEVIVDFLEGDPDRPVVLGSLYNEANLPPLRRREASERSRARSNQG
jgi:type VI secretion system secreted protein VgrG